MQGPVLFSDIGIRAVNTLRVMQFRRIPGGKVCVWKERHTCQQILLLHTYSLYMYTSKGIFNCMQDPKFKHNYFITVTWNTFIMNVARYFFLHGIKTLGMCSSHDCLHPSFGCFDICN